MNRTGAQTLITILEVWGVKVVFGISTNKIQKGTGALHKLNHQDRLFENMTKERVVAASPDGGRNHFVNLF